jgi:peptidyl-prolyl cis-trans isomerase SurA
MNFLTRALALACFCSVLLSGVQAQTAQQADFIVAVVNSEPITNSEVRAESQRFVLQLQQQRRAVPAPEELKRVVLERLINERAQLQFARETGIRMDDAIVDRAEQAMARQNQIDVPELHRRLVKDGTDIATYRAQLRDQQLLSRLYEREVDGRIRISEQDIDRYLLDLQAKNTDPFAQEINLAQILIALPEKASAEQAAGLFVQATKVLDRIRAGEDFDKLLQEVSAADRTNGGQLGLRRADRYPPSFVQATAQLAVGGVSDIVRSAAGFHILKVLEKRAPATVSRAVVQTRAQHILLRPSAQLTQAAAMAQLVDFKKRIQAGTASFASLARQYSQDSSAAQGGDLGWANPGMFVPEFEEVMNQLAEGEVSAPLVSRFGLHLIQVVERRRVDLNPKELRESVRNELHAIRYEEAFTAWATDIRGRAFVEMREAPQ